LIDSQTAARKIKRFEATGDEERNLKNLNMWHASKVKKSFVNN